MIKPVEKGHSYCVTSNNTCTITTIGYADAEYTIATLEGPGQITFIAPTWKVEVSDDDAIFTELPFNYAPALGGSGGGGKPFDGHLNADLVIGQGNSDAVRAEWTLHLGDTTSEGSLSDNKGHNCSVFVKPKRWAQELVDDINLRSSLKLVVEARYVSETEMKLIALVPGAEANKLKFTASYFHEPRTENPCFGSGPVEQTVLGKDATEKTSYSATLNGDAFIYDGYPENTHLENNLWIGHSSSSLTHAACILEIAQAGLAGTISDNNGHTLSLPEDMGTCAEGYIRVVDPNETGSLILKDDLGEIVYQLDVPPAIKTPAAITVDVKFIGSGSTKITIYDGDDNIAIEAVWPHELTADNMQEFVDFLCSGQPGSFEGKAKAVWTGGETIELTMSLFGEYAGEIGNTFTLKNNPDAPYEVDPNGEYFTGGSDGSRTIDELVSIITGDPANEFVSAWKTTTTIIRLLAYKPGAAGEYLTETDPDTKLFYCDPDSGLTGGVEPRSINAVKTAIDTYGLFGVETEVISPTQIKLTDETGGPAANDIVYQTSGCFGFGTVYQGSFIKGADAKTGTAYKIFLNGRELDVDPIFTPVPLVDNMDLVNKGVYILTADGTATDIYLTGVTINTDYATAEIWYDKTGAATVHWPTNWVWVEETNEEAPSFDISDSTTGKRFGIAVRNDGKKLLANVAYSYKL